MNKLIAFFILFFSFIFAPLCAAQNLPTGFVYLHDIEPSIIQEMRYTGDHNFMGRPIVGYEKPTCILTSEAARALKNVQTELRAYGYSLKVYDCYRPQRAVNDFYEWSQSSKDQSMKAEFYPRVNKKNLFKLEYIADRSGHTRGSTVDLTVVNLNRLAQAQYTAGQKLANCYAPYPDRFHDNSIDMGTGFDCLDKLSHLGTNKIPKAAQKNRHYLQTLMFKNGFKPYPKEWWHFTLIHEPFPTTYFDFPVQ